MTSATTASLTREFQEALNTHVVGYSWTYWNEERVLQGLQPLELPVAPAPLAPLLRDVERVGLRSTRLPPGTPLFRGLETPRAPEGIRGLDERAGGCSTLTLDRVTSFTPYETVAREHGPTLLVVTLASPEAEVFADLTSVEGAYDPARHCGDVGVEVQLMPGTYAVRVVEPNM